MMTVLHCIISFLITMEFVLGIVANGFIVLVNCIDWIDRQKISSVDQVLTALAVSRIGLLWILLLSWHANVLNSVSLNLYVKMIVSIVYMLANHFSVWLATVLSIFYLLKIANFSSFLFLYLKKRVRSVLIIVLLVSLLFLSSNFGIASFINILTNRRNMTHNTTLVKVAHLSNITVFTLANFIPFTMSLISLVLLIVSLSNHLKKMQVNGKGFEDPSTKVHIRAMQTVTSFLLLFAGYILALIITVWNSNNLKNSSVLMLCQIFGIMYPSKHSFVLIWGNKKLKHIFLSFLRHLRCQSKERK
ncbi:taste receptor type 2 member 20-like [Suncus etruscus]|uniref:taste receptor type 2 member 20-like n=1 Tax=Suncus etruscus TaxID=109475 RepID=UPI002110A475|nr:taste receptor type 2 member 20-like [Suncus etruscus]